MKKIVAVLGLALGLVIGANIAFAVPVNNAWHRAGNVHVEGILYAGSAGIALTDATGNLAFSSGTTVSAPITAFAGGGQQLTGSTLLSSDYNVVGTCATAADSVTLPAAASGKSYTVFNNGAAALAVFPFTGDTINAGSADASVTVPVNGMANFRGYSDSAWRSGGEYAVNGGYEWTGATGANKILVPDNLAKAWEILEGTNSYIKLVTTNSGESVTITPAVTITGALTQTGQATFAAPNKYSVSAAFAAGGSSKTDATALTLEYSTITGTALQGVSLLTAAVGLHQVVYNDSAVTLILYPLDAGNDTLAVNDLAALTADTGYAMGPLSTMDCTAYTTTAWHCTYTPGTRSTVAAAGTAQASCTQLASATIGSFVSVTGADATKAVCLPNGGSSSTYTPGCITIQSTVNTNTAYLPIFGTASTSGDTINGAAADAVFTMGAGATVRFCTIDGVAWLTR